MFFSIRGRLSSISYLSRNTGILVSYIVGAILQYRMVPCVFVTFPIVFAIWFAILPNTPQFHLQRMMIHNDNQKGHLQVRQIYLDYKMFIVGNIFQWIYWISRGLKIRCAFIRAVGKRILTMQLQCIMNFRDSKQSQLNKKLMKKSHWKIFVTNSFPIFSLLGNNFNWIDFILQSIEHLWPQS